MKSSLMPLARHAPRALFAATLLLSLPDAGAQEAKPKPERSATLANVANASTAGKDFRSKIDVANVSIQELARLLEAMFEGANFVVPQTVAN